MERSLSTSTYQMSHGGDPLRALLELAERQASAPDLASSARAPGCGPIDARAELDALLTLLGDERSDEDGTPPSLAAVMGRRRARHYRDLLAARAALLGASMGGAREARVIDVHPPARHAGGELVGPIGLNLHAQLAAGARLVEALLEASGEAEGEGRGGADDELGRALVAYRRRLAEGERVDAEAPRDALAGAVCIGMVRDVRALGEDVTGGGRAREDRADTFETALEELLDVCDVLAARRAETVPGYARDYLDHDRPDRAGALLRIYTARHADDVEAWSQLGHVLETEGDLDGAVEAHRRVLARTPADWTARRDLGIALLGRLEHDEGIAELGRALELHPGDDELRAELERAETLGRWRRDAERDEAMPAIAPCELEREAGGFREETLALAEHLYGKYGTLQIDGVFDESMLEACRTQFLEQYRDYLGDERQDDALPIGHRRFQVSLALRGAFNDPGFYANPFVLALVRRLLGRKAIVGSTVCATSLPGARDQHLHKDHRAPFTTDKNDDPIEIPPVSITTMIPLVALDAQVGSTLVRKGSHRFGEAGSASMPSQVPIVPLGSCFLMDLSLSHQGLGNRSERVRPIVNMVYHQPWFADNRNFKVQPPLQIEAREFARIPRRHRRLFDWCIQPGPQVSR